LSSFQSLIAQTLEACGQPLAEPDAVCVGLDAGDQPVLLSSVRLNDEHEGLELWLPLTDGPSPGAMQSPDLWVLVHRLNYETRFSHDWRIASGDDGALGLRRRLALEALTPEALIEMIDEGTDRIGPLRQLIDSAVSAAESISPMGTASPNSTMIRG